MAALLSTSPSPSVALPALTPKIRGTICHNHSFPTIRSPLVGELRIVPKIQLTKAAKRSSPLPGCFKTIISCSTAQFETLQTVQSTIAKRLSIDQSTVTPQTKFADLGADSLDMVEIMIALEEKFEVSIGEGGGENIATIQDAADLIERVKAAEA